MYHIQTIIIIIVVLLVAGLLTWAIDRYLVNLSQPWKGLVIFLVILAACLYILHLVGVI